MRLRLDRGFHDLHLASRGLPANGLEHLTVGVLARRHLSCVVPGLSLACIFCKFALFALCECVSVPCFSTCMLVASMFGACMNHFLCKSAGRRVLLASTFHSLLVP